MIFTILMAFSLILTGLIYAGIGWLESDGWMAAFNIGGGVVVMLPGRTGDLG